MTDEVTPAFCTTETLMLRCRRGMDGGSGLWIGTEESLKRFVLDVSTNGGGDIVDLTPLILRNAKDLIGEGLLHLFIGGSTAGITTIEHEPGLVKHDLPALFKRIAPDDASYFHEQTWHDDNGHSHLLASVFGPSLTVPFGGGKLLTGEWQQIVLIDFDTRPRRRKVVCTASV